MKKEVTIGFRTDVNIKAGLEKIAREERRTVAAVIDSILYRHLKKLNLLPQEKDAHDERKI